ncbi:Mss51 protein [Saccharomycopsis crataegensis]|uniref:Mss51 protein n=1 Tax=Saccharomycopsis crataegensis TaxID=43959 RepID=A0AAV5QU53_9ASCO|nr:Mss51 protein [Saccharomycopsis crataegensis]
MSSLLLKHQLIPQAYCRQFVSANGSKRHITNFVRNVFGLDPPPSPDDPTPENRFHPWDSSPSPDLRTRAALIKANARCPVTKKEVNFTCPLSGIPTHHSKEAWESDTQYHESKKYETLKKVNIYEHDLRSGRPFPEFNFPADQEFDRAINFGNWDAFSYTRSFYSMDTEFQMAAVTKMLSYPITIGSVLHQYSPYSFKPKGPITLEGLKSLAALRYSLYPPDSLTSSLKDRPMRIFIIGARAESQLPPHIWKQLCYLFPETAIEIHFIGPECYFNPEKRTVEISQTPIVQRIDAELELIYHTDYFHVFHNYQDFFPYDPYLDAFFVFHPGFGATDSNNMTWKESVEGLLETKCPIFITGYHENDSMADYAWLEENFKDKMDVIFERSENVFGSTKWELNDMDPQEVYQFNQKIFGVRGKRYHIRNSN